MPQLRKLEKRKCKKLALQFHADKNKDPGVEEKFKEIPRAK